MAEIWKDIEGCEGYQISNLGNARSIDRVVPVYRHNQIEFKRIKGCMLKPRLDRDGYCTINPGFSGSKKRKILKIHRLVAQAFIPNPNNYSVINHIDENPENNRVDNLEWCTHKYNTNYGTARIRRIEKQSKGRIQFDKQGNLVKEWNNLAEIFNTYGYNKGLIAACCQRKRKTAYGYIWRYKPMLYDTSREVVGRLGEIKVEI